MARLVWLNHFWRLAFGLGAMLWLDVCLSAGQESRPAQSHAADAVFLNRSYHSDCADGPVSVRDGEFHEARAGRDLHFAVVEVLRGDLTGDGRDEAIVRTYCEPPRTSQAFVFTFVDGQPALLSELESGSGAMGGIRRIWIEDRKLHVERLWTDEIDLNTPKGIELETYRWHHGKLEMVGEPVRKPYVPDSPQKPSPIPTPG